MELQVPEELGLSEKANSWSEDVKEIRVENVIRGLEVGCGERWRIKLSRSCRQQCSTSSAYFWSRMTLRQITACSTHMCFAVAILKYHPVEPKAPRGAWKNQNYGHVLMTTHSIGALRVMKSVVCGELSGIVRSQNSRLHLNCILQATEQI